MLSLLSFIAAVEPSTKGTEYIIAIVFLVVFIVFIKIFKTTEESTD